MLRYYRMLLPLISLLAMGSSAWCQRLITYESGVGSRDPNNSDVWILYQHVVAEHEGMTLTADSALLNTRQNDFTAFRNIFIRLNDTTTISGGTNLYYDGTYKVINIWGDTIVFQDGRVVLRTDHLTFDRVANRGYYDSWGIATSDGDTLTSRIGQYDRNEHTFYIYQHVLLYDSSSLLVTDTLIYNTDSSKARFVSPSYLYTDSATLYSQRGYYITDIHYAESVCASHIWTNDGQQMVCDTLRYYDHMQRGYAIGNVWLYDSLNNATYTGQYGETDQSEHLSMVTDSAMVLWVDKGDSLFLTADTIWVANTDSNTLDWVRACRQVRIYRGESKGICDSAHYTAVDSTIRMFYSPVLWHDHYQVSADTISAIHDTAGVRMMLLRGNVFVIEQVDIQKYSQVKGRDCDIYCREGEPDYADIMGSAEMVYYITEESQDGDKPQLVGVNVGVGSDMRIYFHDRRPQRVVTMGNPDMTAYPFEQLPVDKHRLLGFRWLIDVCPTRSQYQVREMKVVAQPRVASERLRR